MGSRGLHWLERVAWPRAALLLAAWLAAGAAEARQHAPDFASLESVAPSIVLDLRYAGSDNFVGAPIDGYRAARCLLTRGAASALSRVQADLRSRGLGLVVFDCYRPQRAVDHFMRWAADPADTRTRATYYPNVPKSQLFPRGYIAERSSHSRGSTVDLGLVRWRDGETGGGAWIPVDMGTRFDFFDPRSHTEAREITESQRANRLLLRSAMEKRGFRNYPKEWWHYTLEPEPHPDRHFDVVIEPGPRRNSSSK